MSSPHSSASQNNALAGHDREPASPYSLALAELNAKKAEIARAKQTIAKLQAHIKDEPFPFMKLPLEIRLKIYKLAQPHARIIEVQFARKPNSEDHAFITSEFPALLQVNRESRAESLKKFKLVLGDSRGDRNVGVYMDLDEDRLFLRVGFSHRRAPNRFKVITGMADRHRIKHVMVGTEGIQYPYSGFVPLPLLFPNLHTLTILSDIPSGAHIGDCDSKKGTACIHPFSEVSLPKDYSQAMGQRPGQLFLPSKSYELDRNTTTRFLDRFEDGFYPGITWQEPTILYEGLCMGGVGSVWLDDTTSKFYYTPPPKVVHSKPYGQAQVEKEISEIPKVWSMEVYDKEVRRIRRNAARRESVARRKAVNKLANARNAGRSTTNKKAAAPKRPTACRSSNRIKKIKSLEAAEEQDGGDEYDDGEDNAAEEEAADTDEA